MIDMLGKTETSEQIAFYSDASTSKFLGFGGILNKKWIKAIWSEKFIVEKEPSIDYLELFALSAGILAWESEPELSNARITVFCDNMGVVHMVNNKSSKCKNCMFLLGVLSLNGLKFNQQLTARYVTSKNNFLANALSRNQMSRFRKLGPYMNQSPDQLPDLIWPPEKIWQD